MTYATDIADATARFLKEHPTAVVMGAGVTDVKHVYGTTAPAHEQFPDRVIETPLSEQMLTGACAGMADNGMIPIFVHQRADFSTLSVEHLVNTAAKHKFLFGDVPMMVRMVVGQGWGCGVAHSQNFAHWFANVPGLDVHMPIGRQSIRAAFNALGDGKSVVLVEHRRLYGTELTAKTYYGNPHISILAFSAGMIDALTAEQKLSTFGIQANVIPVTSLSPLGVTEPVRQAMKRPTIVVDIGPQLFGLSAEVTAQLYESGCPKVARISPPHYPCPASAPLEAQWYPSASDIVNTALGLLGHKEMVDTERDNHVPSGQGAF